MSSPANRSDKGPDAGPVEWFIDEVRVSTGKRYKARSFMPARRCAMDDRTLALFHFDEKIEEGGFRQRVDETQRLQEGDISGSGDNHEPGGMPLPGIHCSLVPVPPLYISYVERDSTWPS